MSGGVVCLCQSYIGRGVARVVAAADDDGRPACNALYTQPVHLLIVDYLFFFKIEVDMPCLHRLRPDD